MSVISKLKFKEQQAVILNLPEACQPLFDDLSILNNAADIKKASQVLLFAEEQKVLGKSLKAVVKNLADESIFWIAYPKKSGSIKSDLSRDDFWDVLKVEGYAPVMQIALDKDWSALRFRKTEAIGKMIRNTPMEERKIEGVDFKNRTATLPNDALAAIQKVKGLESFFNDMTFSHKKEYVQSIVEAKKEETRKRRIDKMVEMVVALREKKRAK